MATSELKKETLNIEGMHCAGCVSSVEKALANLEGVDEATVNLATETASVSYDVNKTSLVEMRKAVEEAGYSLAENQLKAMAASASSGCSIPRIASGIITTL